MVPLAPSLSIISAMSFPILLSPLAEIVATCSIYSLPLIGIDNSFKPSTTLSTAIRIPFLKSIGFIPAATLLHPSLKNALAKIVAVVVPSPASSLVLEATYLTNEAPMLWYLLENSISFATVTPSLVILGFPKLLSKTTFLPFGPRVT